MKLITSHIAFRYIVSGGTGACVQIGGIYVLHGIFGMWYVAASALAFVMAIVVSFLMHKFWTFKDRRPEMSKQFVIFFIIAIINLGVDVIVIYGFVHGLHMWYLLAQILTSAIVALWSFFVYRLFVFKMVKVGPEFPIT
jgi:putative flippase GtrA